MLYILFPSLLLLCSNLQAATPEPAVPGVPTDMEAMAERYYAPGVAEAFAARGEQFVTDMQSERFDQIINPEPYRIRDRIALWSKSLYNIEGFGHITLGDLALLGLTAADWYLDWVFYKKINAVLRAAYRTTAITNPTWPENYSACLDKKFRTKIIALVAWYTIAGAVLGKTKRYSEIKAWVNNGPGEQMSLTHASCIDLLIALRDFSTHGIFLDGFLPEWQKHWGYKLTLEFVVNLDFVIGYEQEIISRNWMTLLRGFDNNLANLRTALEAEVAQNQPPVESVDAALSSGFKTWLAFKTTTTASLKLWVNVVSVTLHHWQIVKSVVPAMYHFIACLFPRNL